VDIEVVGQAPECSPQPQTNSTHEEDIVSKHSDLTQNAEPSENHVSASECQPSGAAKASSESNKTKKNGHSSREEKVNPFFQQVKSFGPVKYSTAPQHPSSSYLLDSSPAASPGKN